MSEFASLPKHSSVKTLLNGLFDYAGLFPPASLPLEDALDEYLTHRGHPDAWMLGPFVIPVSKLESFIHLAAQRDLDSPIALDVLPEAGASSNGFIEKLNAQLSFCAGLEKEYSQVVSIEAFEFKFPTDLPTNTEGVDWATIGPFADPTSALKLVDDTAQTFLKHGFDSQAFFGELVRGPSFIQSLPLFFMALANTKGRILGKIRCGGMASTDFPSCAELSEFIFTATKLSHPFKATAGLHHPIRHFNTQQQVTMHGFINVLFASTLARVHDLNPKEIEGILEDENPNSFVFSASGIQWNHLHASNTQFIEQRRLLTRSIGSCSFDEPRFDLVTLGWLSHEEQ